MPRLRFLLFLCLGLLPVATLAADVSAVRSWRAPDNTRLVLDVSAPVAYRISHESTPARLILEIDDSQTQVDVLKMPRNMGPLKLSRFESSGGQLRLVIDLSAEVNPKVFQLAPNEKYGQRLVLDLFDRQPSLLPDSPAVAVTVPVEPVKPLVEPTPPAVTTPSAVTPQATVPPLPPKVAEAGVVVKPAPKPAADMPKGRNIVIAIDAGHGGEDPGAIGMRGTHEKIVTLAIAKELQAMFEADPGITAVLTRSGDYFIPLQERRQIARNKYKADVFISIHADAAENRAARGASVFALSLKGAGAATSRFARMLAERENRADLIGGVALERDDDVLRNVLADMVVAGSLEHSLHMGRHILTQLDPVVGKLHSPRVEQAGFAVLKEPGMVSLLVETGFISNPDEENKLTDKAYQREVARAVRDGTRRYLTQYPAPGTYFAWLAEKNRAPAEPSAPVVAADGGRFVRHRVERGDNLTRLAERYQTSLADIRELNKLADDNVKVGQLLRIPVN